MQQKIARIVTELPEARRFALAGGGAMLAHGSHDREDSYPDRCQKVFAITRKAQTPTKRVTFSTELHSPSCALLGSSR
jgi:hypothetical protein